MKKLKASSEIKKEVKRIKFDWTRKCWYCGKRVDMNDCHAFLTHKERRLDSYQFICVDCQVEAITELRKSKMEGV